MFGILYALLGLFGTGINNASLAHNTSQNKKDAIEAGLDYYYDERKKCHRYVVTDEPCTMRYGDGVDTFDCLVNTNTWKVIKTYKTPRRRSGLSKRERREMLDNIDSFLKTLPKKHLTIEEIDENYYRLHHSEYISADPDQKYTTRKEYYKRIGREDDYIEYDAETEFYNELAAEMGRYNK